MPGVFLVLQIGRKASQQGRISCEGDGSVSDSSPASLFLEKQHVVGDRFCIANRVGEGTALAEQMRSAGGGWRGLFEVPSWRSLVSCGTTPLALKPLMILRIVMVQEQLAGCSKRLSSEAAASEEARRALRYVESLSDARTKLADFFSILLGRNEFHSRADERLSVVEPKRLSRAEAVTCYRGQKG